MDFARMAATTALAAGGALLVLLGCDGARAQQPSPDQISAIRQSCRSDFMANCSGVQPGGKDALECLKRNLPKLSGACKTAVSAIGPAAPASEPPAASPPSPAAAPAVTQTPSVAPPAAAPKPPATPTAKRNPVPPPPRPAAPVAPSPPPSPPHPATAVAPQGPDVLVLRPGEALRIIRICAADQRAYCADIPPGGGRIVACLMRNASSVSPPCKEALALVPQ
jgi:hypothetical protein